ncbi:hypothetical protein [Filimonas effusa]|uniref:Sigma-70 family RNA polymerase sigma factor n=1 Tax=Filimonas effusa TaxID=2508721 RepID=A0A4Q1DD56_9BACT|nr:hypothetical protein [Filimonas effusa]RXK86489.1 hypothetical protein ESB13_06690 [Filimonas effusa]
MMEYNDDQLLAHLRKGSTTAFKLIYNKYALFLAFEAHLILDNAHDTAIAVDQVFEELRQDPSKVNDTLENYLSAQVWEQCKAMRKAGHPPIEQQLKTAISLGERLKQAIGHIEKRLSQQQPPQSDNEE